MAGGRARLATPELSRKGRALSSMRLSNGVSAPPTAAQSATDCGDVIAMTPGPLLFEMIVQRPHI